MIDEITTEPFSLEEEIGCFIVAEEPYRDLKDLLSDLHEGVRHLCVAGSVNVVHTERAYKM
jgi:hypothetical protein